MTREELEAEIVDLRGKLKLEAAHRAALETRLARAEEAFRALGDVGLAPPVRRRLCVVWSCATPGHEHDSHAEALACIKGEPWHARG